MGYDWFQIQRSPQENVEVIDLGVPWADCWVCGEPSLKQGIPVYEDLILHNDYKGEWGGVPACPRCHAVQQLLTEPIYRHEFKQKYLGEDPECSKS